MLCNCGNKTKGNKPLCYKCYLTKKSGVDFAKNTVLRLQQNNVKRHIRNSWRRKFTCEMGYGDCELRGYCNGDC
jgi:NMD protein affecting ribosome stability and mRNA decay